MVCWDWLHSSIRRSFDSAACNLHGTFPNQRLTTRACTTATLSARRTVDSRCAMTSTVRPAAARSNASCGGAVGQLTHEVGCRGQRAKARGDQVMRMQAHKCRQ